MELVLVIGLLMMVITKLEMVKQVVETVLEESHLMIEPILLVLPILVVVAAEEVTQEMEDLEVTEDLD